MRITDYSRPATLRRELNTDLSKALAHFRAHHPEKADTWAHRLVERMLRAGILRRRDSEYQRDLDAWKRQP